MTVGHRRCTCGRWLVFPDVEAEAVRLQHLRTAVYAALGILADAPGAEVAAARAVLRAGVRLAAAGADRPEPAPAPAEVTP